MGRVIYSPKVGVGIVVWRHSPTDGRQEVLLGKRKSTHGAGDWSFPGGKIDGAERPMETAIRETEEEIGCRPEFVTKLDHWSFEDYPELPNNFVTLYFTAQLAAGDEPRLMEPDKCEGWKWFNWFSGLPDPLFSGIAQLRMDMPFI